MAKKGFTLLELIVVIIIIGILATLGIAQYTRMIERSRGAEARAILGTMRTHAAAIYMQNSNSCTGCTNAGLGVGTDIPGPAAANCDATHYFWYNVSASVANGFTAMATRCMGATGRPPGGVGVAGTVQLAVDFTAGGGDTWTTTGAY